MTSAPAAAVAAAWACGIIGTVARAAGSEGDGEIGEESRSRQSRWRRRTGQEDHGTKGMCGSGHRTSSVEPYKNFQRNSAKINGHASTHSPAKWSVQRTCKNYEQNKMKFGPWIGNFDAKYPVSSKRGRMQFEDASFVSENGYVVAAA